jgi:hypothetical protein
MTNIISKEINDKEVLVHFMYDRHFKRKMVSIEKLVTKDIFLPNKGGVSLQRALYCTEEECKGKAIKNLKDKLFSGFYVFQKSGFEIVKNEYIENDRNEFRAEIVSSPLDENNDYLPVGCTVYIDSIGNPGHSDIKYLNPAVKENESPNTAIRSFSRKLAKICKLLIDDNFMNDEYSGELFNSAFQ